MADQQRVENVLQGLRALQEPSLSIIRLSEPISATAAPTESNRISEASSSAFENASPASLEADLSHYKELFSKLRFSYLEQVTKEKFLRAIVGSPPQIVEPSENTELESQLLEIKSVLKAQKSHVADLIAQLDAKGRELSRRWETVGLQTQLLKELPGQIEGLNAALDELRARGRKGEGESENETVDDRPEMNLPLPSTLLAFEHKRAHLLDLNSQLTTLRANLLPRQTRLLEGEEREAATLKAERDRVVSLAREAMRRKEEGTSHGGGGAEDEMEMQGRWLQGVEGGVRGMLEV